MLTGRLAVAAALAWAPAVLAQAPLLPPPEFRKPAPAPPLEIRSPDLLDPGAALSEGLRILVKRIRVEGSTVFTAAQLRPIVEPFENRELASEDLDELRHRLTLAYVNAGYINSGAVIPDQRVADGAITIRIIEGRLSEVAVAGEHRFRRWYLAERVALGAGEPFNVNRLQEAIQLLLQGGQIERINAQLTPGAQRGEALLRMDLKEAERWSAGFALANNRSPVVGALRAELSLGVRNLVGSGDVAQVRLGRTRGLRDENLSFSIPVNARDTAIYFRGDRVHSQVIEPPFSLIDLRSDSASMELGVSHPFLRDLRGSLTLGGGFYWRDNATALLGVPFSFTPGIVDGKARVKALRFFGDWLERTQDSVSAARATLSNGLNVGGATRSASNTADSQYRAVLVQLQHARRLAPDGRQLVLRADVQQSSGELLPSEKFAIGGAESVRGYRENQIVRDQGWFVSAEYRHPLARIKLPLLTDGENDGLVTLALFTDAGNARDHFGAPGSGLLWSVGPGARWDIAAGISAQVYYGLTLKKVAGPNSDLQDRGVHFRFSAARAF